MGGGNNGAIVALVLHFRDDDRTFSCLESLVADGIKRLVVVDNSEDSGRSLARLRERVATSLHSSDIRVAEPGLNLGFAKGVNLGLRLVREQFGCVHVLLLNNDAAAVPGACDLLLSESLAAVKTALVAPTLVTPIGNFSSLAYYQPYLAMITRRPLMGSVAHLGGCCLLIPPELAEPPLLDEDFFFYGEDFELGVRCVRNGIALIGADAAKVRHAMSVGSRNGSLFYEYHMARAHLVVVNKLARHRLDRLSMWLGRSMALPVRAIVRAFRHRSFRPLQGLVMATFDVACGRCRSLTPPAR